MVYKVHAAKEQRRSDSSTTRGAGEKARRLGRGCEQGWGAPESDPESDPAAWTLWCFSKKQSPADMGIR